MENKNNSINDLVSIMYDATLNSTNYVFAAYLKSGENKNKPIYNLFAESFIAIKSFCLLMTNQAWSQAAIILRTLLLTPVKYLFTKSSILLCFSESSIKLKPCEDKVTSERINNSAFS